MMQYIVSERAKVIMDKSKKRSYICDIDRHKTCPITSTSNNVRSGDHMLFFILMRNKERLGFVCVEFLMYRYPL